MRVIVGAAVYCVAVMAAGFLLGAAREFLLAPHLGHPAADLVEVPVMLLAIAGSCLLTLRWCAVPDGMTARLVMGGFSLLLVLGAELAFSPLVRGGVQQWIDSFTPATLAAALILWGAHAAMPAILRLDVQRAPAVGGPD